MFFSKKAATMCRQGEGKGALLITTVDQSQTSGVAIGQFKVSNIVLLKAMFSSALELQVAVMVGVSEGER
jgi:fructose/tagatose bisphosphate aldolase